MISKKMRVTAFIFMAAVFLTVGATGSIYAAQSITITSEATEVDFALLWIENPSATTGTVQIDLTEMTDSGGTIPIALSAVTWTATAGTVSPVSGISTVLTVDSGTSQIVTVTATAASGAIDTQDIKVFLLGSMFDMAINASTTELDYDDLETTSGLTVQGIDSRGYDLDLSGIVWSVTTAGIGEILPPALGEFATFKASGVTGTAVIEAKEPTSGVTAVISIFVAQLQPPKDKNPTSGCFIGTAVSSAGSILFVMISAAGGAYTVIRKRKNLK